MLQEKAAKLTKSSDEVTGITGPDDRGTGKEGGGGPILKSILDAKKVPISPLPPFTPGQKGASTGDGDVAAILIAQRDRLQERVMAVERVRDGLKKEVS